MFYHSNRNLSKTPSNKGSVWARIEGPGKGQCKYMWKTDLFITIPLFGVGCHSLELHSLTLYMRHLSRDVFNSDSSKSVFCAEESHCARNLIRNQLTKVCALLIILNLWSQYSLRKGSTKEFLGCAISRYHLNSSEICLCLWSFLFMG